MSGVLCERCEGYFQSSDHLCGAKLHEEVKQLNLALMERDTRPDYERGELDGQDAMMRHIALLKEDNNSQLAEAVRNCPLMKARGNFAREVAEYLEAASFKIGETYDPEAAKACASTLALIQARAERYAIPKED